MCRENQRINDEETETHVPSEEGEDRRRDRRSSESRVDVGIKEDVDIEDDDIEDDGIKRMKKLVHVFNGSCVIGFNGTDCKPTILFAVSCYD